ncbi:MAG: hypothetical protein RL119_288 [Actinomycetota bacterium]
MGPPPIRLNGVTPAARQLVTYGSVGEAGFVSLPQSNVCCLHYRVSSRYG